LTNLIDVYFVKENNIPNSTECNLPNISGIGIQSVVGETLSISLKYKNHICKTKLYIFDLPSYLSWKYIGYQFTIQPPLMVILAFLLFFTDSPE